MKFYFLLFLGLFSFNISKAQIDFGEDFFEDESFLYNLQQREIGKGNITIYQDTRIDSLMQKNYDIRSEKQEIVGFRIQIYFESGRQAQAKAEEIQIKFTEEFIYIPSYLIYNAPFFKIRVGDYRTKSEALKSLQEIKTIYPTSFIIKDLIEFPELF